MRRKLKNDAGITLIELLVVMVIIALFATIVGSRVGRSVDKGKKVAAKSQISEFESMLDQFKLDVGRYPSNEEGLVLLVKAPTDPTLRARWRGPYLEGEIPLDPWGNAYQYGPTGRGLNAITLYSYGPTGKAGGDAVGFLPAT